MTRLRLTSLTLLAVTCLCLGCTPKLPDPTASIEPEGRFTSSGEVALDEQWWTLFNDPVLNRLVEQGHSENLTIKSAWDRLDQAGAVARQAGSSLLPSLDANAAFTSTRTKTSGITSDSDLYSLGLAAGYELDLWGRVRGANKAADLELLATGEDLKSALLTVTAEVATTWLQLVEQYGQKRIINEQIAINGKTLELVELQFRTGKVGIADLLQQRQLVERNRGELTRVEVTISLLEHALAILLGKEPGEAGELEPASFHKLPPLPETGLKIELLERRPDIQSAWYAVRAANQRTRSAIADRFPKVTLGARASTSSTNSSGLFDDWATSLSANLLGPIIDGGNRRAEVDRRRAITSEALNRYRLTVLEAITEVEDALVRELRQADYLASLEAQLELSTAATERIRDRYTKGSENYQRVLDSILSEQSLQRSILTARRQLYEYRIALYRSLAGGWQPQRPAPTVNTKTKTDNLSRVQ